MNLILINKDLSNKLIEEAVLYPLYGNKGTKYISVPAKHICYILFLFQPLHISGCMEDQIENTFN